jgi:hypothetical protein
MWAIKFARCQSVSDWGGSAALGGLQRQSFAAWRRLRRDQRRQERTLPNLAPWKKTAL